MRKAQGALEYLIIIAAVLAIAAIVVLFLTGAFTGASGGGDLAKCRLAASSCANNIQTGVYASNVSCVTPCLGSCGDARGYDVVATTVLVAGNCATTGGTATGCVACIAGRMSAITR